MDQIDLSNLPPIGSTVDQSVSSSWGAPNAATVNAAASQLSTGTIVAIALGLGIFIGLVAGRR